MKNPAAIFAIIFSLFCALANAEQKYVEIKDVSNISEIEFSDLKSFEKYAVGDIFFCQKTSKAYVLVGETYYSYNLQGYKTIADFKTGSEYKNASDYYESVAQKIPDAKRFYFFRENRFKTGADALDAYANGYAEQPTTVKFEDENIEISSPISNSYYDAKELGIETLSKYVEYLFLQKHGFASMEIYKIAKSKGFKENSEYQTATEKGFETKDAWDTAKKYNLETFQEYKDYAAFAAEIDKTAATKKFTKEEAVIYHYFVKVPKDSYSLEKLGYNIKEQMNGENKNVKAAVENYVAGKFAKNTDKKSHANLEQKKSVTVTVDPGKKYYVDDYKVATYEGSSGEFQVWTEDSILRIMRKLDMVVDTDTVTSKEMTQYVSDSVLLKIINESKELGKYNEKTGVFTRK